MSSEILQELLQADEDHAAALRELDELLGETLSVRSRADEVAGVLGAAPAERERLATALAAAEAQARERADALAAAAAELAAAEGRRDRHRVGAARRLLVQATDDLAMAEKRVAACRSAQLDHERRAAAAAHEAREIEGRAAGLAAELRGRPRLAPGAGHTPEPGLAGVADWASGARAALLVARSGIAGERESVARQANELASSLLGEPQAATSVAAVARRVERALRA